MESGVVSEASAQAEATAPSKLSERCDPQTICNILHLFISYQMLFDVPQRTGGEDPRMPTQRGKHTHSSEFRQPIASVHQVC